MKSRKSEVEIGVIPPADNDAKTRSTAKRRGVSHWAHSVRAILDLEDLQHIPFLDVIESTELDAALQALTHFAGVVLDPLQCFDRVLADDRVVANHAGPGAALHTPESTRQPAQCRRAES